MPYVELRDIRINYERTGRGDTIVLLHGGFSSLGAWQNVADQLSHSYDVLALDSRGQGGSTDGAGPITYGRMMTDVVGVLDALNVDTAHFVGHSDGGCTTVQMMVDHPDRMRSATLVGTPLHLTDYPLEVFEMLEGFLDGLLSGNPESDPYKMGDAYRRLSPHPERWTQLVTKLKATWLTQPIFTDDMLRQVDVPVLVVGAGKDEFLPRGVFERTSRIFANSELVWIDKGTHAVPIESPEEVASAVADFIEHLQAANA